VRFNDRFLTTVGLAGVAGMALGVLLTNGVHQAEAPSSAYDLPVAAEAPPPTPAAPPAPALPDIGIHAVEKVISGEIVVLEGAGPVRLLGVDSQKSPDGKPLDPEVARALLQQLIGGKTVMAECDPETADTEFKSDDDLTLVYLVRDDGMLVNTELVGRGAAFADLSRSYGRRNEMILAERDARWANRGVWQMAANKGLTPVPPSATPPVMVPGRPPMDVGAPAPVLKNAVLVTSDGRFHRPSCKLSRGGIGMTIEDARAKHYLACPACFASQKLGG
jgi:endonuclease YncB( thermonuclease family)